MALEFIKLFKGADAVSKVGNYGFFQLSSQSSGGGESGGDIVFSRTFSENSPEVISQVGAEISKNNMTSSQVAETYGWNIGDTTDITLTNGKVMTVFISGINHDILSSDNTSTAGLTLEMRDMWYEGTRYNYGDNNGGGYQSSLLRTRAQSVLAYMPQDWKNIIQMVDKKSANGGGTNYTEIITTSESLFTLSLVELTGLTNASGGELEGVQYEFWKSDNASQHIKQPMGTGSTSIHNYYWLRSCQSDSTSRAYAIRSLAGEGAVNTLNTSYSYDMYSSWAFCVGAQPPRFSRTFSENTPEQISTISAEISANNMTSEQVASTYGWNIGDTISYQLTTGENVEMRIIGFNHDDKSDGTGKAGITLEMTHCLANTYKMNNSNTNAGGYPASVMKTTTLPSIKATLPQEWQDVIKLVDKKCADNGGSSYSIVTSSEDLFLMSYFEIIEVEQPEGSKYEYYAKHTGQTPRIKKYDSNNDGVVDTAGSWWTRSPGASRTTDFKLIFFGGNGTTENASSFGYVSFAFCI